MDVWCTVETFMTLSLEQIDDEVMAKAAISTGLSAPRGLSSGQSVAHGKWPLTGCSIVRPSVQSLALIWCSWQKPRCGGGEGGGALSLRNHTLPIILLLIPQFVSAQCLKKEDFLLDPNAHRHRNRLIYRVGPSLERRRSRVTDQRKGPPTPPSKEQEAKVGRYTAFTAYCAMPVCHARPMRPLNDSPLSVKKWHRAAGLPLSTSSVLISMLRGWTSSPIPKAAVPRSARSPVLPCVTYPARSKLASSRHP